MVGQLILTLTRACQLRCSYCPTVKEGWPSLSQVEALRALELFDTAYGGGDVKLFGGEPLLAPDVVRAVLDDAESRPAVGRVFLSTNGLALDREWLAFLASHPKAVLCVSLDGRLDDHQRHRSGGAAPGAGSLDGYGHLMDLWPQLVATPRLVVNQTIAPDLAAAGADNFAHLLSLGLHRFNILPCYYVAWSPAQLEALRASLETMAAEIQARWARGASLHLRNLFVWAPTPLFNAGLIVDADGTIHSSNVGMASPFEELLDLTRVGTLAEPPAAAVVDAQVEATRSAIADALPREIWDSTIAVDRELSRFCLGLYGDWAAYRRRQKEIR